MEHDENDAGHRDVPTPTTIQPPNSPVTPSNGDDQMAIQGAVQGGEMGPFFHQRHHPLHHGEVNEPYLEEAKSIEEETKHTEPYHPGMVGNTGMMMMTVWNKPYLPVLQTSNLGNGTGEGGGGGTRAQGRMEGDQAAPSVDAPVTLPKIGVMTSKPGLFQFCVPLQTFPAEEDPLRSPNKRNKLFTDYFTDSRNYRWRLMYFPLGNNAQERGQWISLYLEIDTLSSEYQGYCRRHVTFNLKALNLLDPSKHMDMGDHYEFTAASTDWGFPRFFSIDRLRRDPGFVFEHHIFVEVTITDVAGIMDTSHYDSKKETGMVGLKNQGATCYMNSLLQTLWNIWSLRKAVYDMPTENENSTSSVALALQRVFFRLQTSDKAVSTKELTKAFGWEAYESFLQQDVQELNRILCDKLEEKMKGTRVDGTIKNLFEGRFKTITRCLHVEYVSEREETFYDIQLDVKGCGNLEASFRKYIELETLTGENKYEAEGYGKQDAERGVRFTSYPPVLTIHLKRFEFEPRSLAMVKINDRFEFPPKISLDPYMARAEGDGQGEGDGGGETYCLHSVLVHSGDVHAGHYYAYIRPAESAEGGNWYKYDDECVTLVTENEALEDSYGQPPPPPPPTAGGGTEGNGVEGGQDRPFDGSTTPTDPRKSFSIRGPMLAKPLMPKCTSSAYMLVYVRERDLPMIMKSVTDADIPDHLHERFRKEKEEADRKQRELREGHLYTMVEVVTEQDVANFHRYTPAKDFAPLHWGSPPAPSQQPDPSYEALGMRLYRVKKADPVCSLMLMIRDRLNIPLNRQRLWVIQGRQNKTHRVDHALTKINSADDDMVPKERDSRKEKEYYLTSPLQELAEQGNHMAPIKLFLEHLTDHVVLPFGQAGDLDDDDDDASLWGPHALGEEEEEEEEEEGDDDRLQNHPADSAPAPSPALQPDPPNLEQHRKRARADVLEADEGEGEEEQGTEQDASRDTMGQPEETRQPVTTVGVKRPLQEKEEEEDFEDEEDLDEEDDEDLEDDYEGDLPAGWDKQISAIRDGRMIKTLDELIHFFRSFHLPHEVPRDHIILFFKYYNPNNDPQLTYLGHRLVDRKMFAGTLLQQVVQSYFEGADAEVFELCEEVTPLKVNRLSLDKRLDEQELMNGDIIVLQDRQEQSEDSTYYWYYYNRPAYPQTVAGFFNYLIYRRVVHMRPLTSRESGCLEICAPYIREQNLEVSDRCRLVYDSTGKPMEIVLELPVHVPYQCIQEALAQWLRPVVDNIHKIRFTPRDPFDDTPSRTNQINCYTETLLQTLLSHGNNAHRPEVLYFEVLPFSTDELDDGHIKDVVLNDVRLREAYRIKQAREGASGQGARYHGEAEAPVSKPSPPSEGTEQDTDPPTTFRSDEGSIQEATGSRGERPHHGRVRKRCLPTTFMNRHSDPPILSVLIPKLSPVKELLEVVKTDLDLEPDQGLRVLVSQLGRILKVVSVEACADDLMTSPLQETAIAVCRFSVLDLVDPLEIELMEAWRATGEEEKEDTDRQLAREIQFSPLQVTFLNLNPDQVRSTQASTVEAAVPTPMEGISPSPYGTNAGMLYRQPQPMLPYPQLGHPMLSYITSRDTTEDLLGRLAVKLGQTVDTLREWAPAIVCRQITYPLPGEQGAEDYQQQQQQPPPHENGNDEAKMMETSKEGEEVDTQPPDTAETMEEEGDNNTIPMAVVTTPPSGEVEADHPVPSSEPPPLEENEPNPEEEEEEGKKRKVGEGAQEDKEEEEGEGAEGEEETASKRRRMRPHGTALWELVSRLFPKTVCQGAWDVTTWMDAPLLTFLRADGVAPVVENYYRDDPEPRRKSRRYDQGIKIRDS